MTQRDVRTRRSRLHSGHVILGLLAAAGCWFAYQVALSISMPIYGDEATKVIAASMILDGGRLYDDIFHHHSPLIFAFVQPIAAVFGTSTLVPFRLASALLLLVCAGAVGWSPLLRGWRARLLAVALFLATAGTLYNGVSLFRLIYQPVTGNLVAIFLALFAVPLLSGVRPSGRQSVCAGLAAGLAFGTNTGSGGPIVVILFLALAATLFQRRTPADPGRVPLGAFGAGLGLALGLGALWLALYGDFRGFLVFNIHFNMEIYARFVSYNPLDPLYTVAYFVVGKHPALFAFVFGTLALAGLAFFVQRLRDRACGPPFAACVICGLFGLALVYLNMRGGVSWHTGTLVVVASAFFALVVGALAGAATDKTGTEAPPGNRRPGAGLAAPGVVAAGLAIAGLAGSAAYYLTATSTPTGAMLTDRRPTLKPPLVAQRDGPLIRLVRRLTPPDRPIYVMPFWPEVYLLAERDPASGHFFYLPWQAAYERAPVPGHTIDVCEDLTRERPPVIIIVGRTFAGRKIADYAPCVVGIVARGYRQHPRWRVLYVRRDLAVKLVPARNCVDPKEGKACGR